MSIKKQMKRHLGKKATRRIYAAMPWAGGALALAAVGAALQKRAPRGVAEDLHTEGELSPRYSAEHDRDLVGSH